MQNLTQVVHLSLLLTGIFSTMMSVAFIAFSDAGTKAFSLLNPPSRCCITLLYDRLMDFTTAVGATM